LNDAHPTLKIFFRYWLAPAVWAGVVLAASNDAFSAQHTRVILEAVARTFFSNISPAALERIHVAIRKSAHLTEYAILAGLFFRAFRAGRWPAWQLSWARRAFSLSLVVAAFDEFHQGFVPSRGSSPWDVLLDSVGAAFILLLIRAAARSAGQRGGRDELLSSNR
jgi:VanZ family protein